MTTVANKQARRRHPVLEPLAAINAGICRAGVGLAALLLMLMTAIVLTQIVFRYVLNDSLIWTEEVSKTMMVWAALLVAPWAYRTGANVRIEMFVDALPQGLRAGIDFVLNLLVVWIVIVFLGESFGLVERGMSIRTASLPLAIGWFYTIVPVAFAAMLLVGIEQVLRQLLGFRYPDEDFSVPGPETVVEGE